MTIPLRPRRARSGLTVLVALVALVPAGCSEAGEPSAATSGATAVGGCPSPDPAETGSAPLDPGGTASAGPAPVPFRQPGSTVGAGFDVEYTVFDYKQPAGAACPDPAFPDREWAAVDAQTCAKALPAGFEYLLGWSPWSLTFADGTTARIATRSVPGFEEPRYPDNKVLPAGQCLRGWVTMSVPKGKRPATVVHRAVSDVHAWTVPPPS